MSKYRDILNQQKGTLSLLRKQRDTTACELRDVIQSIKELEEARDIVNAVMQSTQNQVKTYLEDVVSLALKTVLGDAYSFKIEYEVKRNKSEANLYIMKDNQKFEPRDEVGGGVLDIAALGLRVALWSLADPKPEPVLFLDEPARFVSRDRIEHFNEILKKFSEMFNVQIIMISHDEALISGADQAFHVSQENGVSKVEEVY